MRRFPSIISFYTKDTLYQLEVQNLIESCQRYGLDYHIEGIDSFGSWELNCAYKPFFIHRQLQTLKQPLLWVDADAIFVQSPQWLPAFDADLAVRINEELAWEHPSRVMSGTLYANYTPGADQLLRSWALLCQQELTQSNRSQEFWDQIALRDVLRSVCQDVRVQGLPKAYAKIADHRIDAVEILSPVIEHYQASRRYKSIGRE